jgi:uncharacterized membrane protein
MRIVGIGHLLFAIGLIGLGVLSLFSGDFAYSWQPVPAWVPWRETLAHLSGALLIAGGIGILIPRTAAPSALAMTIFLLSWALLLQAPLVAHNPGVEATWLGLSENVISLCGGWILFASLADPRKRVRMRFLTSANSLRVTRMLIGAACLGLGFSHFVYSSITASMVPAWLPYRLGFAYLTGAGHIAAGLALLFFVLPRLAATMEAAMISTFVLLLHIPAAIADPKSRLNWTMVFVATLFAGSVWAAAKSLQSLPWFSLCKLPQAATPQHVSS